MAAIEDGDIEQREDNIWPQLKDQFPVQVEAFKEWVDKYKAREKWHLLFKSDVKFHDLPFSMQLGAVLEYFREHAHPDDSELWFGHTWSELDIKNQILNAFGNKFINDNIQEENEQHDETDSDLE